MQSNNTPNPLSNQKPLSRRGMLGGLAWGAGALLFGAPLLSACGSPVSKTGGGIAAGKSAMPTYVPIEIVKPDLPGTAAGVQPGFLSFPKDPKATSEGEIGAGGPITALVMTYSPPPPPVGSNPFWQDVNKKLNVDYKPALTPAGDFATKFSAVTAGSTVPDLVQVPAWLDLPRLPALLENVFEDLTPHLAGDAIKDYPNLANIPSYSWRNSVYEGKLYGPPLNRPAQGNIVFKRTDIIDECGAPQEPKNVEEFEALCKAVTNPKAGRYAIASSTFLNQYLGAMFSVAQNWKLESDGSLVKDWETDEWMEKLEFQASLFKKGYVNPDSATLSGDKAKSLVLGGKAVLLEDGMAWWTQAVTSTPDIALDGLIPVLKDGGQAKQYSGAGAFSFTALRKASPERIKELLRFLNYLASPFGSKEYFELNFGAEGRDHTISETGSPVLTDEGRQNITLNLTSMAQPPQVLFSNSGLTDVIKLQHAFQSKLFNAMTTDPTMYHYSETASKSGSIKSAVDDVITGIIVGRQPLSDFAPAVKKWASAGGDKIREELQEALAAEAAA